MQTANVANKEEKMRGERYELKETSRDQEQSFPFHSAALGDTAIMSFS